MNGVEFGPILTAAGSLLAALGGWEFVKYLLNHKSNSRIAEANAFKVERDALVEDYKRVQLEVDDLKKQVAKLNKEIDELKDDRLRLKEENSQLKIQLKEAEKHICWRPKDECFMRLVESDDCLYRKIIRGVKEQHPNAIVTEEDMKRPHKETVEGEKQKNDKS